MTTRQASSGSIVQDHPKRYAKQKLGTFSGTDPEQAKTNLPQSPTPSWRKPDPSQWRYGSRRRNGH